MESLLGEFHDLVSMVAEVRFIRGSVAVVSFSEDKDVIATTERILEDRGGSEVYI